MGVPFIACDGGVPFIAWVGGTLHCLGGGYPSMPGWGYPSLPATCFGLGDVSAVLWEQVTCELFTVGTFF